MPHDDEQELQNCVICLEKYFEGEGLALSPCQLKHAFHFDCLTRWTKLKLECPICREEYVVL
jgi:hypothetical protein